MNGTLAVDRVAERVYDAAEHCIADRDFYNTFGSLDRIAFADILVRTQDNGTDQILFKVLSHAIYAAGELKQLTRHTLLQAVDVCDTVADGNDCADIGQLDPALVVCDLLFDYCADFIRA